MRIHPDFRCPTRIILRSRRRVEFLPVTPGSGSRCYLFLVCRDSCASQKHTVCTETASGILSCCTEVSLVPATTAAKDVKHSSDTTGVANKVRFEHIVVAVDGSTNGRRAAKFAANLALGLGSRLTVVTVVEPPNVPRLVTMDPRFLPDYPGMIDSLREAAEAQGRQLLEEIRSLMNKITGLKPDVRLEMGPVRETLLHIVSKLHPDLLVVGTRGMTGIRRFIVGSVSETMVRHAACSVVVVR